MKRSIIKKIRTNRKRFISLTLTASMLSVMMSCAFDIPVFADKINDIQEQIDETKEEIQEIDSQLVDLMAEISVLESEIATNAENIQNMQQELALAQQAEQTQYNNMKARMRYLYENGDTDMLSMFMESQSFTAFLNNVEYANMLLEYDRTLMDSYEATRIDIEEMTLELQENQLQMEQQQVQLASKRESLDSMLTAKKAQVADYEVQLKKAKEEAARKAAEAARRAAAKKAAENAAAVRAAAAASSSSSSSSSSGSSGGSSSNAAETSGGGYNPAGTTGVSGASVVSYANQFVGNPYVFGGNSLTDGIDCSGFVVQVYGHFGINLSGSRNSAALRSVGSPVSYEYMQAGDIVCYAGHVGIYTGNGTIVEAQDSSHGITNYRSVTSNKILAIRRVI